MTFRACILVSLSLIASSTGAEDAWTTFQFEAYNREFVDVRSNSEWEQEGAIRMKVRSPTHRLVIRDHELALRPAGDGRFHTRIRVNFSGEGDLEAEISLIGADQRLQDHVIAPLQEVEVFALVRFTPVEEGYEVETIELPDSVDVAIESQLGKRLVEVCKSALSLLGAKCSGLDATFSTANVPLPSEGATYFIDAQQLSRSERRRLDRFLASHN